MLRLALLLTAVAGAAYVGMLAFQQLHPVTPAPPPPKIAPNVVAHQCLDLCEQQAIVAGADPEIAKACRVRCNVEVKRPYEPIRSITRAPADHNKP